MSRSCLPRREFLALLGGSSLGVLLGGGCATSTLKPQNAGANVAPEAAEKIQTVRGPILARELGFALAHEHVLVDFVGADQVSPSRYDAEVVFEATRPHLQKAHFLGGRALFECTPAFLGRDPRLLARLSEVSGLHLVTNTGLYGAANDKFLPPYAFAETAEQLAARWIAEAREGIDHTGIRPGFIKSGIDPAPEMSAVDRKLVDAAALTHRETGLTIAVHTGRGPGLAELDVLAARGVAPAAFVWVHAQNGPDDALFTAASRGAWLSFDGLARPTATRHLNLTLEMKKRGWLAQVLLSHDAGWYDPGKPEGGRFRPYDFLFVEFVPLLRENGFTDADLDQLFVQNPARAFAIKPRLQPG